MRTLALIITAVLLSPLAASQEIFRWVDKNGVVHYSDQPGPGAERVTITGSLVRQPDVSESPALYESSEPEETAGPAYRSISIIRPDMNEAFFGSDTSVDVVISLDGELRSGDEVALFFNSARVGSDGLTATISGVGRGTHSLRAAVLDASGNVMVSSPQVLFHVRQASIATAPVGPSLRPPPPKPAPKPANPKVPTSPKTPASPTAPATSG